MRLNRGLFALQATNLTTGLIFPSYADSNSLFLSKDQPYLKRASRSWTKQPHNNSAFIDKKNNCIFKCSNLCCRKLSSPNKRSLTRQRNKTSKPCPELFELPPPLTAHQFLLRQEKCLSDNDGDDECDALIGLLPTSRHAAATPAFASMPRQQGRHRKKSRKVEDVTVLMKDGNNLQQHQHQHQQQRDNNNSAVDDDTDEARVECEPLLDSNSTTPSTSKSKTSSSAVAKLVSFNVDVGLSGVVGGDGLENDALPGDRSKK